MIFKTAMHRFYLRLYLITIVTHVVYADLPLLSGCITGASYENRKQNG